MKYISNQMWRDLTDGHLYEKGEEYPYNGRKVPAERIEALQSGNNKAGIALISPLKGQDEENPTERQEPPKKPVKSRKKAIE